MHIYLHKCKKRVKSVYKEFNDDLKQSTECKSTGSFAS